MFISDLPLILDGFQFGEERKFREGEVVLFEILAVFVAGDFADEGKIVDAKFKTYGCGSAIASSSLVTEWVKGKSLDEAAEIKNTHIAEELALPPVKIHCSVLAEDAIAAAIENYRSKNQ